MIEKINFDFTKKEDRKKFDKLPKEKKEEIAGEAQEGASLINEIVGEKGSKEDYEIITKLAEEEIASKKEIENLKEIYSQKLENILNSQLTVENIEIFADNALAQTTNLIDDIRSKYQKYQNIFEPADFNNAEQEDKALVFFGLPDAPGILQSIIEVKEKIDDLKAYIGVNMANIDEIITPPDNRKINTGNEQRIEQKRMFPRVLTLFYILEHDFDISPTEASIVRGIVTPNMVRQTPYMRVEIPELDRVVYICDEEGNASYVFDAKKIKEQSIILDELDLYSKEDKNSLISRFPGIGIRIKQTNAWRNNITLTLKERIFETNILENKKPMSEFRRERVEYLSFDDFQREVRSCYLGERNIEKWFWQEKKNHNNWPSKPYKVYKDRGWEGFPGLMGKENLLKKKWLSFEDFRREVRSSYSGGDVQKWYKQEYKKYKNWPSMPNRMYENKGWNGWSELVEKENHLKKEFLTYINFKTEVKALYPGQGQVKLWYILEQKKHSNWPADPSVFYKNKGWEDWAELVGRENMLKREWLSFEEFKTEVKKLYPGKGGIEKWYWLEQKKHSNWPSAPRETYRSKGWQGFPELAGK